MSSDPSNPADKRPRVIPRSDLDTPSIGASHSPGQDPGRVWAPIASEDTSPGAGESPVDDYGTWKGHPEGGQTGGRNGRDSGSKNRSPSTELSTTAGASIMLESLIQSFKQEWDQGREPRIDDYLDSATIHCPTLLSELLHTDLEYRLTLGYSVQVESYLQHYPGLQDSEAVGLIVRDFELRRERGMDASIGDYLERFARFKNELAPLLRAVDPSEKEQLSPVRAEVARPAAPSPTVTAPPIQGSHWPVGLEEDYEILGLLGEGGMGKVLLVRHRRLKVERAVKVIVPMYAHNDKWRERLNREAQAMARLRHPNAVTVHNVRTEDLPYIEMEYVRGKSLKKYLEEHGPLSFAQIVQVVKQLCDVLEYAHKRLKIVHRDLKPANLMVEDTEDSEQIHIKVMDFGLVKALEEASDLTTPGDAMGTCLYMSPEQWQDASKVDERSDIFSIGVILYELLTGARPFVSTSAIRLYIEICQEPPPPFRARNPEAKISPAIEQLVLSCLQKDPDRRPASAKALSDEFIRLANLELKPQVHQGPERVRSFSPIWMAVLLAALGASFALALTPDEFRALVNSLLNRRPVALKAVPNFVELKATEPEQIFTIEIPRGKDAPTSKLEVRAHPPGIIVGTRGVSGGQSDSSAGNQGSSTEVRIFTVKADPDALDQLEAGEDKIVFGAADGNGNTVSIGLRVHPPVWDPIIPDERSWVRHRPNAKSEPDMAAKDRLFLIGHKIYPAFIERKINGVDRPVIAILIKDGEPRSSQFYIMRDKVWNQLYQAFERETGMESADEDWKKGWRGKFDWRWPVLHVNATKACAFAHWLGGKNGSLPTPEQWDRAGGCEVKGSRKIEPRGIAVDRQEPMPVGEAAFDVSASFCRDVFGNGLEWTRPGGDRFVPIRSASFINHSPFAFQSGIPGSGDNDAGSCDANEANEEVGFRTVIELRPEEP